MKKLIYIFLLFLWAGCSDFLKDKSQDLVVAKSMTDLDETLLGSGYIPSGQQAGYTNDEYCPFLNLLDDDVNGVVTDHSNKIWNDMRNTIYGYTTWQAEVGRTYDRQTLKGDDATWKKLYARINAANIILNELSNLQQTTDSDKRDALRIEGECRFLRAQLYLILTNLYGRPYAPSTADTTLGVPLKLTNYVEFTPNSEGQFQRDNLRLIYSSIVVDLQRSIVCLTESPQARPLHRASKEAATLLLSRVYLYMQDWNNARLTARAFLQMRNELVLLENSTDVMLDESSREVLFSQGSLNIQNILIGSDAVADSEAGGGGGFCVSNDLYSLYDTLDYRREVFFRESMHTDSIVLNKKFNPVSKRSHVSDVFMLRTAEGYLNMAEACAMLNDAEANTWLNDLRRIRVKNHVNKNYSGEQLIEQVRLERRKELCFEGHRWFDLRRYSVCETAPYKKDIFRCFPVYDVDNASLMFVEFYRLEADSPAYVFAIPKSVMDFDRSMVDNFRPKREVYSILSGETEDAQ